MPHVSSELVDATWRAFGISTGEQMLRIQETHRKAQGALTVVVYERFAELREVAAGLGSYVYHVVLETFLNVSPRPRRVRRTQIEEALGFQRQTEEFAPDKSIEQSSEPQALRYVFEALYEDSDDVVLSEKEGEHIFGVLEAAIVCLHDACKNE